MHPFLTHRALVSVIDPLFTPALSFLLVRVTGWLSRWTSPTQSTLTLLAKVATTSRGWWRRRAATSISQTLTGTTRRRKATRFVQRQTWIVMHTLRCDGRDVYRLLFRALPHHMFSFNVIDRNIAPWLGLECKSNAVCCLECLISSSVHNWFWKMFLICAAPLHLQTVTVSLTGRGSECWTCWLLFCLAQPEEADVLSQRAVRSCCNYH